MKPLPWRAALLLAALVPLAYGAAALDEWSLRLFRHAHDLSEPLGPRWLRRAMTDITALGSHAVLTLAALAIILWRLAARRPGEALTLLASSAGALALNAALKNLFARERPSVVPPLAEISTFSYPSGHALMFSAISLAAALPLLETARGRAERACILFFWLLLAALVGLSRVYLGVHYLTDVAAGTAAGCAWALSCRLALRHFTRN